MSKTIATPQFTHDCPGCTFIGHREGYDVYLCTQGGIRPTVIARYGNQPWEYTSGAEFITSGSYFRGTQDSAWASAAEHAGVRDWVNIAAAVLAEYALAQFAQAQAAASEAPKVRTPDLDTPWKVDPNRKLPVGIIRDDEDGEGLLTIDFGQEGMLHREEAVRLAEYIVRLHNRALALREFQHHA